LKIQIILCLPSDIDKEAKLIENFLRKNGKDQAQTKISLKNFGCSLSQIPKTHTGLDCVKI
jgi:hypothetical protein